MENGDTWSYESFIWLSYHQRHFPRDRIEHALNTGEHRITSGGVNYKCDGYIKRNLEIFIFMYDGCRNVYIHITR